MASRLRITGKESGSYEVTITKPFLTIGSDVSSDLRFGSAGISQHAASIRFREGEYLLFNRSLENASIDGVRLRVDTSVKWDPGTVLRFANGETIELIVEGDPAPNKDVTDYSSEGEYNSSTAEALSSTDSNTDGEAGENGLVSEPFTDKKSKVNIYQVVITAICVIGCLFIILFAKKQASTLAETNNAVDYSMIAQSLSSQPENRLHAGLLVHLQAAEYAYNSYQLEHARERYERLRTFLATSNVHVEQRSTTSGDQPLIDSAMILNYVEARLAKIMTLIASSSSTR